MKSNVGKILYRNSYPQGSVQIMHLVLHVNHFYYNLHLNMNGFIFIILDMFVSLLSRKF